MGDGTSQRIMGDVVSQSEGNALLKAVFGGKLRLTRLLLEGGAYINEGNERGETPLAAACLASYDDQNTRVKMVRYLLEKGADPNIPDTAGRTALMHACQHEAGQEVVSLLLENAADPSLKDYSGSSALIHAINRGDRNTLKVLLDACKAKGKEVIIITTDTSPSGTKKTKQYLNAPPSPCIIDKPSDAHTLSPMDNLFDSNTLSPSCMSPSQVEIRTSNSPLLHNKDEEGIFSFSLTSLMPLPTSNVYPTNPEHVYTIPNLNHTSSIPNHLSPSGLNTDPSDSPSSRAPGEILNINPVPSDPTNPSRANPNITINPTPLPEAPSNPAARLNPNVNTSEKRPPPRKLLKRLNSEPWGLVAPNLTTSSTPPEPAEPRSTDLRESWGAVDPLNQAVGSLMQHQNKAKGSLMDLSRTTSAFNGLSLSEFRPLLSRRHSIETPCSPKAIDRSCSEEGSGSAGSGSWWADKVQQHQILYRRNTAPETQENTAGRVLIHPKLTRMDHYESDSHLSDSIPGSPECGRVSAERRRLTVSPLLNSRDSLDTLSNPNILSNPNTLSNPNIHINSNSENIFSSVSPLTLRRRTHGLLERRGSGTLLLDHLSHSRPGFLPRLNVNLQRPIPDIRAQTGCNLTLNQTQAGPNQTTNHSFQTGLIADIRANGRPTSPNHSVHPNPNTNPNCNPPTHSGACGLKLFVPVAPSSPKRSDFSTKKKLIRRHSMQTEQMKQLSTFQEILRESVSESNN